MGAIDKPLAIDSAIRMQDNLLANYVPSHISAAVDAEIGAKFPIRLQIEDLLKTA